MAKSWAKSFYNSKAWKDCRKAYIAERISIDGGLCEYCKKELGTELDHVEELTPENIQDPDVTLNFQNFKWACHTCHTRKTKSGISEDDYYFDENGMVQMYVAPRS